MPPAFLSLLQRCLRCFAITTETGANKFYKMVGNTKYMQLHTDYYSCKIAYGEILALILA